MWSFGLLLNSPTQVPSRNGAWSGICRAPSDRLGAARVEAIRGSLAASAKPSSGQPRLGVSIQRSGRSPRRRIARTRGRTAGHEELRMRLASAQECVDKFVDERRRLPRRRDCRASEPAHHRDGDPATWHPTPRYEREAEAAAPSALAAGAITRAMSESTTARVPRVIRQQGVDRRLARGHRSRLRPRRRRDHLAPQAMNAPPRWRVCFSREATVRVTAKARAPRSSAGRHTRTA